MFDDLLTMPLQLKCMKKIILQKPNAIAYGSLAWISGLKSALGAEKFGKMAFKI